jgi:D-glycero-alpha-D-manno-heptose-7-phosphate kinase
MIISKTPLRVSFVGGGSDVRGYYRYETGAVVSTAINKYVFVNVNRKFDEGIRVAYSRTEEVSHVSQVEHKIVRAALSRVGIQGGIEITTIADIPGRGTGLGSSSTFAVGLLHALYAFSSRYADRDTLASEACHIEIAVCNEPIGKQDQYAAAFGGLNLIEFHPDESVNVSPIISPPQLVAKLQKSLLVLYTGRTRSASAVLADQNQELGNDSAKSRTLRRMVQLSHYLKSELESGNLGSFGEILHENWILKKSLNPAIAPSEIDAWYETGRRFGAKGGKILGAGAGGFLLFFAPPETHDAIAHALPALRRTPIAFERSGSQIIFYNP